MRWCFSLAIVAAISIGHAEPWLYQLQSPNPRKIAKAGFPAVVMDYSVDGDDASQHRPGAIKRLNRQGITTLAYFSIGEAENYRFYWDNSWVERRNSNAFTASAPNWLGHTNPDWKGNYKVRYWDPAWRNDVLAPYLDRIIGQGFDGVYLDIIDAFEYWAAPSSYRGKNGETFQGDDPRGNERLAARRMIDLVRWIASYGRKRAGGKFLVFPQNGENILRHDRGGKYLRAISGIGVEDLFYDEIRKQPAGEVNYRLRFLRKIARARKTVLCVDYVDDGSRSAANTARIADFVDRCEDEGFDRYVARKDRELDRINRIPGVQP